MMRFTVSSVLLCALASLSFAQQIDYTEQIKNKPSILTTAPIAGAATLAPSATISLTPCAAFQIYRTNAGATAWQCVDLSFANLAGTITSTQAPHAILSAFHTDTTVHTVVRGDLIAGIGAVPKWTAVAAGGTNAYPKWNASGDVIASTGAAGGTGTCAAHKFVTSENADSAPTCTALTGADLSSITLLNEQGPLTAVTGTGAAATLYTYTMPANTIAAGKGIRAKCWATHSAGTGNVTISFSFGGTSYQNNVDASGGATIQYYSEITVFNNAGVVNAQHGSNLQNIQNGGILPASSLTSAIDTTLGTIIKIAFTAANTEQVTPGEFLVEIVQ